MKGMKDMKEMAQKGLKRCTHACTRSVNEIMPRSWKVDAGFWCNGP